MISVVCMGGLGDRPEKTFGALKQALSVAGCRVIFVDVEGVVTHEDRIQRVLYTFRKEEALLKKNYSESENKLYLAGQSAGGGAVREAAARLHGNKSLSGIINLSPSMPFGPLRFNYLTKSLVKAMFFRFFHLILWLRIYLSEKEYTSLVVPIAYDRLSSIVANRQVISGREAFELAFFPPSLKPIDYPMLYIYGDEDHWVATRAHRQLSKALKLFCPVSEHEIEGAGHLTLESNQREHVFQIITRWVMTT